MRARRGRGQPHPGRGQHRRRAGPVRGPGRAPGLTAVALETLDLTRREARLSFDAVPAELASDPAQAAWLTRVRALAALAVAAGSLGGIRRCLEMATGYAKERTAFGRTIGSFQAVKHMCADMLVDLECTRAAVEHAAKVADQASDPARRARRPPPRCPRRAAWPRPTRRTQSSGPRPR